MYLKLSWGNLWRNKRRTLITMASIVFAVLLSVLMYSIKDGLLDKMKENVVGFYTGYVQVHKNGYWDEKTLENTFEPSDTLIQHILSHRRVKDLVPRLESFSLAASEKYSKGCMVVGINPEKENAVTRLQSKVVKGSYLEENDRAALLTEGLANYLRLEVGDTLVIIGQGYRGVSAAGKYVIKGLVKFGSPDLNSGLVYLPLKETQWLYGATQRLSAFVLLLKDNDRPRDTATALQANIGNEFEVMSWQSMIPELDQVIQGEDKETVIFLFVLYMLITFGIFGTILMMTLERKFEFGVLVAIGMKKHILSQVVIMENILISILGALGGLLLSVPFVFYLYKFPIKMSGSLAEAYENFGIEPIFYFSMAPDVFYTQMLVVLIIALVLSFYPLVKIQKLDPVSAMRE